LCLLICIIINTYIATFPP